MDIKPEGTKGSLNNFIERIRAGEEIDYILVFVDVDGSIVNIRDTGENFYTLIGGMEQAKANMIIPDHGEEF